MQLKHLKVIFSAFILVLTLFAFSTSVLAFSVDSKEKCFDECDANCKDSTKYANKKIANDANRITFCPDKFDAAEGKGKCHCGCGLIPMPSGTKDGKPNCDYTLCDFFSMVNNILDMIMLYIAPFVAICFMVYGAVVFVTAGGAEDKITKGKKILTMAIIGLIIVWGAWVVIDFIMQSLLKPDWITMNGPWNNIKCN